MIQLHDVDLKLLRVFAEVVKCGGFSAAQAVLNVGQSTISEQMGHLETRLGVRLCERGRAGFRLTEQGAAVHEATQRLLTAIDNFRMEADVLKRRISGELNLGVIDNTITDPGSPLPEATRLFASRGHDVHINVYIGAPGDLEQQVLGGQLHAAIAHFPFPVPGLTYSPLYAETHGVYCGRHHPLYRSDLSVSAIARELPQARFVARGYMHRRDLDALGIGSAAATVDNVEAQAILILSGAYVGFLPTHYAARWVESGDLKQLLPNRRFPQSTFSAVSRRGATTPLILRTFLEDLERAARAKAD